MQCHKQVHIAQNCGLVTHFGTVTSGLDITLHRALSPSLYRAARLPPLALAHLIAGGFGLPPDTIFPAISLSHLPAQRGTHRDPRLGTIPHAAPL